MSHLLAPMYLSDRLPSGREVEIFYLEDLLLQQVPSSKASRARAQQQQPAAERSGTAGTKTTATAVPAQPTVPSARAQKPVVGQAGGFRGEAGPKKKSAPKRK
jgi:hypothetical protein